MTRLQQDGRKFQVNCRKRDCRYFSLNQPNHAGMAYSGRRRISRTSDGTAATRSFHHSLQCGRPRSHRADEKSLILASAKSV